MRPVLVVWLAAFSGAAGYAQSKSACELLPKADAEAVLGVTLQPPGPTAPFRSLLDEDFAKGNIDQGCSYASAQPAQSKVAGFFLEVRYSPAPNPTAVEEARKRVDERTYDDPVDIPGRGDAAFSIGAANNTSLFVFRGG